MSAFGRRFGLSEQRGHGVSRDQTGLFVGAVPLLEPCRNCVGFQKWRPRPMDELNRDLSNRYGVLVQSTRSRSSRGHCPCARSWRSAACAHRDIAPTDPRSAAVCERCAVRERVGRFGEAAHASGLLKRGWDPSKHPRWPAGSLDSVGGRFAPADAALGAAPGYELSASTRTAQALPIPFEAVTPRGAIPSPFEIALHWESFREAGWKIPILIVKDAMRNGSMPKNIAGNYWIAAYWERVITGNTGKCSSSAS